MIAAPALDQRDRPRQRRAAAGTEVFGEGLGDAGRLYSRHMPLCEGP